MKKCFKCEREFDDDVQFCSGCGTNLGEAGELPECKDDKKKNVKSEPVSVGEWLVMLVNIIPFIGQLVYFIIMLVWAFSDNIKPSKKTFAKANLIIYAIAAAIFIALFLLFIVGGIGLSLFYAGYPLLY